jgi:dTDP-4-dehydrorhamnose reductase
LNSKTSFVGAMGAQPILVVGANGQLARALARLAPQGGRGVTCRGRPDTDVRDAQSLARTLDETESSIIVNAAAYTAVDEAEAEPQAAYAVNADGAGHLARLCRDRNLALIHLSTDYVFDGTRQVPYREDDRVAPLGVYGQSKAAGEAAVRRWCPQHVILRTAWLYSMDDRNFLTTMLRLAKERDSLDVVADQHGTPTWAADVADAILAIAHALKREETRTGPLWGTYHLTARGATTWHGFAQEIFRLSARSGGTMPSINAVTTDGYPSAAPRPAYSVLDTAKIAAAFGVTLPPWEESLARCIAGGAPASIHTPAGQVHSA